MGDEKSNEELARGLMFRLVREVAGPTCQANALAGDFEVLRDEFGRLNKDEQEFSALIIEELRVCMQKNELATKGIEIENRNAEGLEIFKQRRTTLEERKKELEEKCDYLNRSAWATLVTITNEMVAGNYGRGILEPHFNTGEIVRVIGAIDEFKERTRVCTVSLTSRAQISHGDVKNVTEACISGHPPLFGISTKIMPLSKEESEEFCWGFDNYEFLKKNVSEGLIPWSLGNVYRVDKESAGVEKTRLYMVTLSVEEAVFVKMEIGVFPHRTLTILGKINVKDREKVDYIVDYLLNWLGEERIPRDLEKVPEMIKDASRDRMVFNILQEHLFENLPGIIVHIPALDGK